jgi:hypothetical protein
MQTGVTGSLQNSNRLKKIVILLIQIKNRYNQPNYQYLKKDI